MQRQRADSPWNPSRSNVERPAASVPEVEHLHAFRVAHVEKRAAHGDIRRGATDLQMRIGLFDVRRGRDIDDAHAPRPRRDVDGIASLQDAAAASLSRELEFADDGDVRWVTQVGQQQPALRRLPVRLDRRAPRRVVDVDDGAQRRIGDARIDNHVPDGRSRQASHCPRAIEERGRERRHVSADLYGHVDHPTRMWWRDRLHALVAQHLDVERIRATEGHLHPWREPPPLDANLRSALLRSAARREAEQCQWLPIHEATHPSSEQAARVDDFDGSEPRCRQAVDLDGRWNLDSHGQAV